MGPKRKTTTGLLKNIQPTAKKLKVEGKEVKESKEEPLEENKDERIEEEKPVKRHRKKPLPLPIDGDPQSPFVCKRYPSIFLQMKEANPGIPLAELEKIKCGSHRILNWECLNHKSCKDHVWKAMVCSRIYNRAGCPFCFGQGNSKKECGCNQPTFKNSDGSYKHNKEHMKRCIKCMEEKPNWEFYSDKYTKDGYQSHCSECRSEYNAVPSAMMRLYLQGKCCQDCEEQNDVVLEFDHVNNDKAKDRKGKPINMGNLSPQKLCFEFKKTEIVCVKCHRIRTHSRYKGKSSDSKESVLKRNLAQKLKLERQRCLHCKTQITEDKTWLFDLDHTDPNTKIGPVSEMIKQKKYSLKQVEEEIAKCQLLCCTCHRKKTAKDGNWRKISDYSEEAIKTAVAFLDKHFTKDAEGNYIHIRPVKVRIGLLDQTQNPRQSQSIVNCMALMPTLEM